MRTIHCQYIQLNIFTKMMILITPRIKLFTAPPFSQICLCTKRNARELEIDCSTESKGMGYEEEETYFFHFLFFHYAFHTHQLMF